MGLVTVVSFTHGMPENDLEEKRGIINDIGSWFYSGDKDNAKRSDGAMKQDEEENDLEEKRGIINDIGSWFYSEDKDNAKRNNWAMKQDEEDNAKRSDGQMM